MHMVRSTSFGTNSKMHKTLRMTLAMASGVSDKLWSMDDIVALVEAADVKPAKRGLYKERG
jgi:hypothetical protein